jgi:trans-aconitate methyltransferase
MSRSTQLHGGTFPPADYHRASFYLQYLNALELLTSIQISPDSNCLDLGCGTGLATSFIARNLCPRGIVLGVDISQEMIDFAERQKGDLINLAFKTCDARYPDTLPAKTSRIVDSPLFDIVFSNYVFHWIDFESEFTQLLAAWEKHLSLTSCLAFRFSSNETFRELLWLASELSTKSPWRSFFADRFQHPKLPTFASVSSATGAARNWSFALTENVVFRRFASPPELAFWIRTNLRPAIDPIESIELGKSHEFAKTLADMYFSFASQCGLSLGKDGAVLRDVSLQLIGTRLSHASQFTFAPARLRSTPTGALS